MSNQSADLVTELRQMAATGYAGSSIWAEAADELERLRQRNSWLEEYVQACDNELERARKRYASPTCKLLTSPAQLLGTCTACGRSFECGSVTRSG